MSLFADQFNQMLERIKARLPEQRAALVPSEAFFSRDLEMPGGLAVSEQSDLVELFLESKAPFPVEQLLWGFVSDPASPHAFAFASTKGRLRQLGIDHPEQFIHLFPAFLALHGEATPHPTVRFIAHNQSLAAVFYPASNPVPQKVVAMPLPDIEPGSADLLRSRDQLLARLPMNGFHAEDGLWQCTEIKVDRDQNVAFSLLRIDPDGNAMPAIHPLPLNRDAVWGADLRDPAFAKKERHSRRRTKAIWTSLRVSLLTAIVLLVWQLMTFGLNGYNFLLEKRISDLGQKAMRVENKFTLANRLTESTEEDIKPFALLESINPLRPDSVYFNRIRARAYNRLEIEGDSEQGVTPVNSFADALNALSFVGEVENNVQTRSNQTSFRFAINFDAMPPTADQPLRLPPPEASDDEPVAEGDS